LVILSSLINLICTFLSFFLAYSNLSRICIKQYSDRAVVDIRWTDENVEGGLRQLQEVGGKFSLEIATEDRVALF
jgi:hypothetical protein